MSQSAYYSKYSADILSGSHTQTYSEYLKQFEGEKKKYDELAAEHEKYLPEEGAIGATTAGYDNMENKWFDMTLWNEKDSKTDEKVETGKKADNQQELTDLWNATKTDIMSDAGYNTVVKGTGSDSQLFVRTDGGTWYEVLDQGANLVSDEEHRPSGLIGYAQDFRRYMRENDNFSFTKYEQGGLADFTGPAWLDGTKSRPEYILNSQQTEKFFSLIDILEGLHTKELDKKQSGDNYFDIEINVEKLENDYDVEKIANKIRSMIYEDATYRNVNSINHVR